MSAVDLYLEMEAVVDEQHGRRVSGIAPIPGELAGRAQARHAAIKQADDKSPADNLVARGVGVTAMGERRAGVHEIAGEFNDARAAHRIVSGAAVRAPVVGDRVRSVERVIHAAPAGVGSVQGITRVHDRDDELRSRDRRYLGIDPVGRDCEILALGQQIADLAQEILVSLQIDGPSAVLPVPVVDLRLEFVAEGDKRAVARRFGVNDVGQ